MWARPQKQTSALSFHAADHVVHNEIVQNGDEINLKSVDIQIVYSPKYKGISLEHVANILNKEAKKKSEGQKQDDGDNHTKPASIGAKVGGDGGDSGGESAVNASDSSNSTSDNEEESTNSGDNNNPSCGDNNVGDGNSSNLDHQRKRPATSHGEVIQVMDSSGKELEGDALDKEEREFRDELSSISQTTSMFSGPGNSKGWSQRKIYDVHSKINWKDILLQELSKKGEVVGINRSSLDRQWLKLGVFVPDKHREELNWIGR